MKKFVFALLVILSIFVSAGTPLGVPALCLASVETEKISADSIRETAYGIIEWKKNDVGAEKDGFLFNVAFLEQAGTTPGDWFPIGLGRLGVEDNQAGYLAVLSDNVQKRYDGPDKLDRAKATEWHRISLAVLASGGNPRAFGEDRDGDGRGDIDLIADGTYARVDENGKGSLGRQGINGLIWGLITLDSMYYEIPEGAYYSRDDIIVQILGLQLADGGWALTGSVSDPDITAMTLQCFAPYYNSEKEYTYLNENISELPVVMKVREACDKAVALLSRTQRQDGDYFSWGMPNCESTVQVLVALTSLGINPLTDERFVKTGDDGLPNTLLDGIMKYRTSSGGFTHSYVNDEDNPTAVAGMPNTMASEQTLYGLTALVRFLEGKRRLYDFREEQSEKLRLLIKDVELKISGLTPDASVVELKEVYDAYLEIPVEERSYVSNYKDLSVLLVAADIPFEKEELQYNSGDAGVTVPTEYFSPSDIEALVGLPETLTTAYRAEVLRLGSKINNSVDFDGKQEYTIKLEKAKNEIDAIYAEIEALRKAIKEELYPFDSITLSKRNTVHELYDRYLALSEYDRAQLEASDIEGLVKSKTQADNLFAALVTGICVGAVAVSVAVWLFFNIRKRKKLKALNAMPESDE